MVSPLASMMDSMGMPGPPTFLWRMLPAGACRMAGYESQPLCQMPQPPPEHFFRMSMPTGCICSYKPGCFHLNWRLPLLLPMPA